MKKILIFTYLHRHLKKLLPVIKEFLKNTDISLNILLMTQDEKQLAIESEIPFKMLDEFTLKKRNIDFDLGWGLEPLINAIDFIHPDLFIAIEVNYILRNAVRYCKQQKIPNLIIQHGTPNKYSLHAFTPFEGDCFAAWGQFTKDYLVANGVDERKIEITGGPCFDRTNSFKPDKKSIAQELGIDPVKKWIVFTTQAVGAGGRPSEDEIVAGVTETAKRVLTYPDYQLIFQVHPAQTIEDIKKIADTVEQHNSIVTKYKDTEALMAVAEGVITFFSTTAIDAIILEKPLLLINLSDDRDFYPFVNMGAAFGAYQHEEIAQEFDNLLFNNQILRLNLKKAAEYVNFQNDGKALERVMKLCYHKLNP